jgi:hypothetical protein
MRPQRSKLTANLELGRNGTTPLISSGKQLLREGYFRWPVAAFSQAGGFQPDTVKKSGLETKGARQVYFRRFFLDCAPCQMVVIVSRRPRTR